MIVTTAPEGLTCTANVLTDPPDPKSPRARCCRQPARWSVHPGGKYGIGLSGGACRQHIGMMLIEVEQHEQND